SLNPVFTVGHQIMEAVILHQKLNKHEARKVAIKMITLVGISDAERVIDKYPHELSGGMRQRIMIAMALSCNPKLLIADEPTTALDVTIQAQILDLMRDIKKKLNTSIMLITHDLGVVAEMADYVVVMYAGKVIEEGPVEVIFKNPMHPYTMGLLKSKPVLNQVTDRLYSIPGQVPNPINMPENCYFNERCEFCFDKCKEVQPTLQVAEENHKVSCWKYKGV
ncbi:MAG: ABC transporter ATP-binding protein, partial [Sarcina sp.]